MLNENNKSLPPFYFHVVVWGERFCDYLMRYCIPSLLAPGNIPSLKNDNGNNSFLICAPSEDWGRIQQYPSFKLLQSYIVPIFIEIPSCPEGVTGCQHMGCGHKLATERCFQDKAYGIALTPDMVVSNNTFNKVQEYALEGKQVVYCPAIRFAEEPFFKNLGPVNSNVLELTGRQLVKIALNSFHSETHSYNFGAPHYALNAPVSFLLLPNHQGMLIHSLSWCPLLLDYNIVKNHNTKTLDTWTMDGDYVYRNFDDMAAVKICNDSDSVMLVSWAPYEHNKMAIKPGFFRKRSRKFCQIYNSFLLRMTLKNSVYDPMKRKLFSTSVYWHTQDLDLSWEEYKRQFIVSIEQHQLLDMLFIIVVFKVSFRCSLFIKKIKRWLKTIFSAIIGNKVSQERVKKRILKLRGIHHA